MPQLTKRQAQERLIRNVVHEMNDGAVPDHMEAMKKKETVSQHRPWNMRKNSPMISQHRIRCLLSAVREQVFTLTNLAPLKCFHIVSLGQNDLITKILVKWTSNDTQQSSIECAYFAGCAVNERLLFYGYVMFYRISTRFCKSLKIEIEIFIYLDTSSR